MIWPDIRWSVVLITEHCHTPAQFAAVYGQDRWIPDKRKHRAGGANVWWYQDWCCVSDKPHRPSPLPRGADIAAVRRRIRVGRYAEAPRGNRIVPASVIIDRVRLDRRHLTTGRENTERTVTRFGRPPTARGDSRDSCHALRRSRRETGGEHFRRSLLDGRRTISRTKDGSIQAKVTRQDG